MSWRNVVILDKDVYWVGAKDWNRRLFDALIPLPAGTTYNSYVIAGETKKVLIDTVNPGFEKELDDKISQIVDTRELDYVIMNHAEPDHAGAIPYIMQLNNKAKLVATKKGAKMAEVFYGVSADRVHVVGDGNTLDIGGKTLQFIEAPMLHWPETMFTYLQESKMLFTCDFFGSHVAGGIYADEVPDLLVYAQKYFGEIMMPFRTMGQRALEKINKIKIDIIAPSHGPIHRNSKTILETYKKWCSGETRPKAVILYVTMWNSTEKMIQPITETLSANGIEVSIHNLTQTDLGDLAKDLVDSKAVVIGCPTVLGGAHPAALNAVHLAGALRPPAKFAVILGSYGWSGGGVKQIQTILGQSQMEVVGAHEINGPPTKDDVSRIKELGQTLTKKIKEEL